MKAIRNMLCIALIAILAVGLVGCGNTGSTGNTVGNTIEDIIGEWKPVSMELNNKTYTGTDIPAGNLTLSKDGTASYGFLEDTTWEKIEAVSYTHLLPYPAKSLPLTADWRPALSKASSADMNRIKYWCTKRSLSVPSE